MDILTYAMLKKELAGKASLVDGKVPASELPSYVDDVVEYASVSAFPATGEQGKIYVALDTNTCYRWSGTTYIAISGLVDQVYDGTSTYAQSGIAIQSVLGNINTVLEEVL